MKAETDDFILKARRGNLLSRKVGEETVIYDMDNDKALCLDKVSAIVWEASCDLNDMNELLNVLHRNGIEDADEQLVVLAIEQLNESNLLENSIDNETSQASILPRCDVLRQLTMYSAAALPLVTSLSIQKWTP